MKSKGQILVFEQVLIFSIGMVILITSFALFMMYQSYYLSETTQDQLTQVKEYVLSSIIKLCEKNDFNSSVILSIPKTIGNSFYRISLSPVGLNITLWPEREAGDFSTLYGLDTTFTFEPSMVVSDMGKIVVYKRGNSIILDTIVK
ncbi:MAG: hypothetical protein JSV39_03555 [Candidatus Aenigmatarchaeota archaeon]|nr:MAG: hypothetical protein JSV39_03555 [Candidatus Aenigmarchaeota archaeon]